MSTTTATIKALEFYSGIGGLHLALQRSAVEADVLAAFEWAQTACHVYSLNFPGTVLNQIDICSLSASQLAAYHADLWLLSPSCQPYTVLNPLAKDDTDPRAKSFLHLVHVVLPALAAQDKLPRYLLIENVAGFETSTTRSGLLSRLKDLGYLVLELLLTPLQFGIPNSRLRYYLLAKLRSLQFANADILVDSAVDKIRRNIPGCKTPWLDPRTSEDIDDDTGAEIRLYLDKDDEIKDDLTIPSRVLEKWGRLFDVVLPSSRRSCCFTRGYAKLVEGTGSILQMNESLDAEIAFRNFLHAQSLQDQTAVRILDALQLRYFSPTELLRLFGFEKKGVESSFCWPKGMSMKSKYRLIGNSVNVDVVTRLIDYLLI